MNLLVAWKKVLLFGLFGAAGCLAGWLAGEPYLYAAALATADGGAGRAPSLISRPVPPSAEPPPLPNDIRERLDKAGGKSGDVQLSLIWYNVNDLDLHCKDPTGEVIYYKNPRARSGGELDVDANAGSARGDRPAPLTAEPVENIYWPKNGAPPGRYQVSINHYARNEPAPNRTHYKVNVLHDGQRHEFEGDIENSGSPRNERMIYEFELKPRLTLLAPVELELPPATAVKVPVAVRRSYYQGPVDVRAENLPDGVTAGALTIPEGHNEGEIELKATDGAKEIKKPIKLVAGGGGITTSADVQLTVPKPAAAFSLWAVVSTGVWTALLAVGLALALLAGQNRYLGKPPFAPGRVPLALVILGAAAAGFVSGGIGQALFFALLALGAAKVGFVVGWVLLGALLGGGLSFLIPNLDGKKAALAGVGGGLLGAAAFLILSNVTDWVGRFGGAALLGFCIGLMVAAVEAAFRRAWLDVRYGDRETITVNLGPEPVKVGGDAKACAVWARGAAPVELRFFVRDGAVWCDDARNRSEATVGDGFRRAVGAVTVVVRTGDSDRPPPLLPLPPPPPPVAKVKPNITAAPKARDGCPGCGRKIPGAAGTRYCMVCDATF